MPPKEGGIKNAKTVLKAARVLEIYTDGEADRWARLIKEFPEFKSERIKGKKDYWNAEAVLAWAASAVSGDDVVQANAARAYAEVSAIGFNTEEDTRERLKALKMVAQQGDIFTDKSAVKLGVDDSLAEVMAAIDGRTRGIPGRD